MLPAGAFQTLSQWVPGDWLVAGRLGLCPGCFSLCTGPRKASAAALPAGFRSALQALEWAGSLVAPTPAQGRLVHAAGVGSEGVNVCGTAKGKPGCQVSVTQAVNPPEQGGTGSSRVTEQAPLEAAASL